MTPPKTRRSIEELIDRINIDELNNPAWELQDVNQHHAYLAGHRACFERLAPALREAIEFMNLMVNCYRDADEEIAPQFEHYDDKIRALLEEK